VHLQLGVGKWYDRTIAFDKKQLIIFDTGVTRLLIGIPLSDNVGA
jgi:hypothetical protein